MNARTEVSIAVRQYLRIARMLNNDDLTENQARRALRALKACVDPEQWQQVQLKGNAELLRAAGWKVELIDEDES